MRSYCPCNEHISHFCSRSNNQSKSANSRAAPIITFKTKIIDIITISIAISQVNALIEQHHADYNVVKLTTRYAKEYEAMKIEHKNQN